MEKVLYDEIAPLKSIRVKKYIDDIDQRDSTADEGKTHLKEYDSRVVRELKFVNLSRSTAHTPKKGDSDLYENEDIDDFGDYTNALIISAELKDGSSRYHTDQDKQPKTKTLT